MKRARSTWRGFVCPTGGEAHGPLLTVDGRLYCPHSEHVGRPKSHSLGALAPSPAFFTMDEAEAALKAQAAAA